MPELYSHPDDKFGETTTEFAGEVLFFFEYSGERLKCSLSLPNFFHIVVLPSFQPFRRTIEHEKTPAPQKHASRFEQFQSRPSVPEVCVL